MVQEHYVLPERASIPATRILDHSVSTIAKADESLLLLPLPALPLSYCIAKRTLDILVSAIVLLIFAPILLLTALIIRLTSRGPAFFRQQRVGEGGRIFTMYKFRSMYVNADHSLHRASYAQFVEGKGGNGKVTKESLTLAGLVAESADEDPEDFYTGQHHGRIRRQLHRLRPLLHAEDPRITPFGALIRITSVDELPQLINVLLGDMSLVGPRPPIPYEVRMYQRKHLLRLAIRPGITGIWQVHGRNKVLFEQMVDMDIQYIKTRTFWLDLKLLAQTVPAVLASRAPK